MLTDKQKNGYKWLAILSFFISFLMIVPFRSIVKSDLMHVIEDLLKYLVFPGLLVYLSIKINKAKYTEIPRNVRQSDIIVMSYLPMGEYFIGLCVNLLHTLNIGENELMFKAMPVGVHTFLFVAVGILFVAGIIFLCNLKKIIIRLSAKENKVLDIVLSSVILFTMILSFVVTEVYWAKFKGLEYFHLGDEALLIIFVLYFALLVIVRRRVKRSLKVNALISTVRYGEMATGRSSKTTKQNAYLLACDHILEELNKATPEKEE